MTRHGSFTVLALGLVAWGAAVSSSPVRGGIAGAAADEGRPEATLATYRSSIEAWRSDRDARLRSPDGWLALTGLHWLEEGASTLGAEAGSTMVVPGEDVPARLGTIVLSGDRLRFEAAPGAEVGHQGRVVESIELVSDAEGEPTVLEQGSRRFHVIRRQDRFGVRLKDSASPALLEFEGMDYFAADPKWKPAARFVPPEPGSSLMVPNVLGTVVRQPSAGRVEFELAGRTHRIEALRGGHPTELFLVFGDQTNGEETYGGGRFLYATIEGSSVDLDFNRAYSPPCVFTPYATCPLAPAVNRLDLRIEAGEKTYSKSPSVTSKR